MSTKSRAIEVASSAFAERGFAGTSLDELARTMGVTKQTILYHFGSKAGLLEEVVVVAAHELVAVLAAAVESSAPGWPRVEASVRASFALAIGRPDLVGLLREVARLGSPASDLVIDLLTPLIEDALAALSQGMDEGVFRRNDPRVVLVSAYGAVTGVVTDAEVLAAVGLELDLRVAAQLRRSVLDYLQSALLSSWDS